MISLEKLKILTPFRKLPKNVGDLGKLFLPKALKSCPKSKKSPNLVTPSPTQIPTIYVLSTYVICVLSTYVRPCICPYLLASFDIFF